MNAGNKSLTYLSPTVLQAKTEPMNQTAILCDYQELRRKSVAVNTRLVESLNKDDIGAAAAALGILHGKHIDLETEDELSVVMDYAIHNLFHDGRNAVDRLLENNLFAEDSPEFRLLEAMQKSHFTLFDVTLPIPGFGVRGLDGPAKTPITIVDVGFSTTAEPGLVLATRLFSPGEGWWMTTGAALPLSDKAVDRMLREFNSHLRKTGQEPPAPERERIIRRACIAAGASHRISYADPGQASARPIAPVRRDSAKVGRNDPCPCGSGRKFKKCCGS